MDDDDDLDATFICTMMMSATTLLNLFSVCWTIRILHNTKTQEYGCSVAGGAPCQVVNTTLPTTILPSRFAHSYDVTRWRNYSRDGDSMTSYKWWFVNRESTWMTEWRGSATSRSNVVWAYNFSRRHVWELWLRDSSIQKKWRTKVTRRDETRRLSQTALQTAGRPAGRLRLLLSLLGTSDSRSNRRGGHVVWNSVAVIRTSEVTSRYRSMPVSSKLAVCQGPVC